MIQVDDRITEYEKQGFDRDQLEEIKAGLSKSVDISIYAKKYFLAISMYQIRLGLEAGVDTSIYAKPDFDWFQMEEIRLGLEAGLDVSVYAKKDYSFEIMRELRLGLADGINLEKFSKLDPGIVKELRCAILDEVDIIPYIKAGYIPEQLSEIRYAIKKKLDINPYLNVWFRGEAIHQIILGLEERLDVSLYSDIAFDWHQMEEIRLGLEHRVDAARYAKKLSNWLQMQEIRLGLEAGLDVSVYESLMYSDKEMHKRRIRLLEEKEKNEEPASEDVKEDSKEPEEPYCRIETYICDGGMSAYMLIPEEIPTPDTDIIIDILCARGITFGYLWDAIASLRDGIKDTKVLVARGKASVDGEDGYYEYLLEGKSEYQPYYNSDGSIDFGKSKWYQTVNKGDVVVKYHPATASIIGKTVDGRCFDGKNGADLPSLKGEGFVIDEDRKTYRAEVSGVIRFSRADYRLRIVPLLVVERLDALNSNVAFDGVVHVKGPMEGLTFISASGDVFVDGFVENGHIDSEGSIILGKGMSGKGKGELKAGGDIEGDFFEHVRLIAANNIRANYCLNCECDAGNEITVLGKRGYIGGGHAIAKNKINVESIGNKMNIQTLVSVGEMGNLYEQYNKYLNNKRVIENQLKILKNAFEDYSFKYTPEQRNLLPLFIQVEDAIYTKDLELKSINDEIQKLWDEIVDRKQARINVYGTVYEGTTVCINGINYNPPMSYKTSFRNDNGKIGYVNIME